MSAESMLKLVIRAIALAEFGAVAGMVMPVEWMRVAHAWLGLGAFPEGGTAVYLARSLSAFYVVHGGAMWVCATDVRRHAAMIAYMAWAGVAYAVFVSALDLWLGMPWYWLVAEGPGLVVMSVAILALQRRA